MKYNYLAMTKTALIPEGVNLRRNIETLRKQRGLSRAELSRRAGKSSSAVTNLFQNKASYPQLDFLVGLSRVLGVTIEELIGDPGEIKNRSEVNKTEIMRYVPIEKAALIAVVEAVYEIQLELEQHYDPKAYAEIIYEFYTRLARAAIDSEQESVDFFKLAERDIASLKPLVKALDASGPRTRKTKDSEPA